MHHTKSTQILYGFIGAFYGTIKIVEYYPKKNINDKGKNINTSGEEIEKNVIILKLEEFALKIIDSVNKNYEIDNKINDKIVKIIKNKEYVDLIKSNKPLFLNEHNDLSTNIAMSSIFYGTLFHSVGRYPKICFLCIPSYLIYCNLYGKN